MIGWITVSHCDQSGEDDELNSIGVYVEPKALGECSASFEMVGHPPYEIEAAFLSAFADSRFDNVDWWTYDSATWAQLTFQMPEVARRLGRVLSSEGLVSVLDPHETHEVIVLTLPPLQQTMWDYEFFCAAQGAINSCQGDLDRIIDRNLS